MLFKRKKIGKRAKLLRLQLFVEGHFMTYVEKLFIHNTSLLSMLLCNEIKKRVFEYENLSFLMDNLYFINLLNNGYRILCTKCHM